MSGGSCAGTFSNINIDILTLRLTLFQRKAEEELAAQWTADKAARDYALLGQVDNEDEDGEASRPKKVQEMMDDFM